MLRTVLAAVGAVLVVSAVTLPVIADDAPAGTPMRLRGTIDSLTGSDLSITTSDGSKIDVNLGPKFMLGAPTLVALKDVSTNEFVGAASMDSDKDLAKAVELQVFPEAFRGAGEGQYPWDLPNGNLMTNGTISQVTPQGDDRLIHLMYKGGEQDVLVSADTPVWTFNPTDNNDLVKGAYVVVGVRKLSDGSYVGDYGFVEKNGVKPAN